MGSTSLLLIWWRVLISYILADDKARANVYKCGKVPLSYLRINDEWFFLSCEGMLTVEKIPLVTEEYTAKINGLRDMITRKAISDANKAIGLDASIPKAYLRKGTACFNLEEYYNAKTAFEACASLLPEDARFTK
ncbi:suppressor of G2 allele of SKP1 [Tanacetum coccineum]